MARLPVAAAAAQQQAPLPPPPDLTLAAALKGIMAQYWGHDEFRPLQEEAVAATLARRDVLVILPTGVGIGRFWWVLGAARLRQPVCQLPLLRFGPCACLQAVARASPSSLRLCTGTRSRRVLWVLGKQRWRGGPLHSLTPAGGGQPRN